MNDADKLLEAVCLDPEDWDLRRVLADAFLEAGEEDKAAYQMWAAEKNKRAYKNVDNVNHTVEVFEWYDKNRDGFSGADPESDLPTKFFLALKETPTKKHQKTTGFDQLIAYGSRLDSETAAMEAWTIAIREGWKPDE